MSDMRLRCWSPADTGHASSRTVLAVSQWGSVQPECSNASPFAPVSNRSTWTSAVASTRSAVPTIIAPVFLLRACMIPSCELLPRPRARQRCALRLERGSVGCLVLGSPVVAWLRLRSGMSRFCAGRSSAGRRFERVQALVVLRNGAVETSKSGELWLGHRARCWSGSLRRGLPNAEGPGVGGWSPSTPHRPPLVCTGTRAVVSRLAAASIAVRRVFPSASSLSFA